MCILWVPWMHVTMKVHHVSFNLWETIGNIRRDQVRTCTELLAQITNNIRNLRHKRGSLTTSSPGWGFPWRAAWRKTWTPSASRNPSASRWTPDGWTPRALGAQPQTLKCDLYPLTWVLITLRENLSRWWTSSWAEQVMLADPAASDTLQVYWPLSSAEHAGSSRVKWFSFATIWETISFLVGSKFEFKTKLGDFY